MGRRAGKGEGEGARCGRASGGIRTPLGWRPLFFPGGAGSLVDVAAATAGALARALGSSVRTSAAFSRRHLATFSSMSASV